MLTATGISLEGLRQAGRKVVRKSGKQVLLLARGERVFALANRCPHEGYPLSEGTDGPGCVLTCNWHNWKFDLETGEALVGRDPVRTFAVEVMNGEIFIDFTEPPADALRERALAGLTKAILDNDRPRMAREAARLERAGTDAARAFAHAIRLRNENFEYGMTHAYAAGADWLALAARAATPEQRLTALLEPVSHLAWDTLGADAFPYAREARAYDAAEFFSALEGEHEDEAIALARGAIAAQIPYSSLRPVLSRAALAHYADFGHAAIYVVKAGELIERLGQDVAEPVIFALVRMLVNATREERLPEFRGYATALASWQNHTKNEPARSGDFIGQSVDGALKRLLESSRQDPSALYEALLGAAAYNLLHFNTDFERAHDNAIADNIAWLDFTHALTFANACRRLCTEQPELWPAALLQMALFVGRNRKYVRVIDAKPWTVSDPNTFLASEIGKLYDHGAAEPIIACHRLKVLLALESEIAASPNAAWIATMCAAVNRFLNTPMKRHHGLRIASQALDFVAREA